jgi:hypothetical protein
MIQIESPCQDEFQIMSVTHPQQSLSNEFFADSPFAVNELSSPEHEANAITPISKEIKSNEAPKQSSIDLQKNRFVVGAELFVQLLASVCIGAITILQAGCNVQFGKILGSGIRG